MNKNKLSSSKGQRARIREDILPRLKAMVQSFELTLDMAEKDLGPLTTEATGAIVQTVFQLATAASAHDAFLRSEEEGKCETEYEKKVRESIERGECSSCGYKPCLCDQQ